MSKDNFGLLDDAEQVLLGSLLGDGSLSRMNEKHIYYSEIYSLKQRDYLLWKMRLMSNGL